MWPDVVDIRDFYGSSLGLTAQRCLRSRVRELWPDVKGERVLGLGYTSPFISQFRSEAERVVALMPASQGVLHWPGEGKGLTALVDEGELPLPDVSVDRVLLVHAIEHTHQLGHLMREAWRVLTGSGKLLIVVPNRRGLWARFERTPFGHGHPYSRSQISRLLRDSQFTPGERTAALFAPPSNWRMLMASAPAWEKIGQRYFEGFGGVVMVEATKQIYATPKAKPVKLRRLYAPAIPSGANNFKKTSAD
ncbi:MAG: class I SAM-dependent methyltransferase [Rhodospirillales bacterium]|nr:class I SAM-dependent methyltransferase [Rhodospirillales bacterium]